MSPANSTGNGRRLRRQSLAPVLLRTLGAAAVMVSIGGCTPTAPHLTIPVEEMNRRVKVVCAASLRALMTSPDGAAKTQAFDAIFLQELRRTNWTVVAPADFDPLAAQVARDAGGSFDPLTGERSEGKWEEVSRQVAAAAHAKFGCDAIVTPSIAVVSAPWSEGSVQWDGVWDALGGGGGAQGYVAALSLWVSIRDLDFQELFFGTGGIQVLSKLESTGFLKTEFVPIATDKILGDTGRNYKAVRAALAPFLPKDSNEPVGIHTDRTKRRDALREQAQETGTGTRP